MATASRYIGGIPHNPTMRTGRYPNVASVGAMPGVTTLSGGAWRVPTGGDGQAVRVMPGASTLGASSGGGNGAVGGNALGALLGGGLGLLQYLPDAYDALFGGTPPGGEDLPLPPDQMPPPEIPSGATPYGMSDQFGQMWGVPVPGQNGLHSLWDTQGRSLGSIDMMEGADDFGDLGAFDPDLMGGESLGALGGVPAAAGWGGAIDAAGGFTNAVQAGTLPTDFGLTGSLGSLPAYGDVALNLANAAGAAGGSWMASGAFKNSDRPYAQIGQQVGSAVGAAAGQILIPVPILGAMAGAAIGGALGGGAGSIPGPAPTIGRNFSSIGTFGGDGGIHWGNSGGDNGAGAEDADPFARWLGGDLFRQAGAQGLAFNPNMAGAQFRVGGYDNFSRSATTPGGFFYTPDAGGSPENYALRPSSDFYNDAYSPGQATSFSRNVLADLTARGVFTQAGQQGPGLDFWNASQGAPLGWYGNEGPETYSAIEYGGTGGFDNILAGRRGAIEGWQNQQQEQQQREATYAQQQQEAAAGNPWGAVGVDAGLIDAGLFGVSDPGGA
jgi:hypothetical protein